VVTLNGCESFSLFFDLQGDVAPCSPPIPETCVPANGLLWCYHPTECGHPCDETCAAVGLSPVADNAVWFAAQDTVEECQAIAAAFGLGVDYMASYTFACLEDAWGTHSGDGGIVGPILCSTFPECPADHRTDMDQVGVPCGPDSRRSICPCEGAIPTRPAGAPR
jgi:hypothetical protein